EGAGHERPVSTTHDNPRGLTCPRVAWSVVPTGPFAAPQPPLGPLKSTSARSTVRTCPPTVIVNSSPGASLPGYQAIHQPSLRLATTGDPPPSRISMSVTPGAYVPTTALNVPAPPSAPQPTTICCTATGSASATA